MKNKKETGYVPPKVSTVPAREIIASLGPASAGSQTVAGDGDLVPNTNSCGFPMGYPCP